MSFTIVPSVPVAYGRIMHNSDPNFGNEPMRVSNPLALIWHWMAQGAQRIHVEEVSAPSSAHTTPTLPALLLGCRPHRHQIQVGGGIRDARTAGILTAHGADTLVIGHSLRDPVQFIKILEAVPGHQIMVALNMDAELHPRTAESIALARQSGMHRILLAGPWQSATIFPSQHRTIRHFQENGFDVWIAGGLRHRPTVVGLKELEVSGVIIGQAFYRGILSYKDLQSLETS